MKKPIQTKNVFEAITEVMSPKGMKQKNEDDLMKLDEREVAIALEIASGSWSDGLSLKLASAKKLTPNKYEFVVARNSGFEHMIFDRITVSVMLQESYMDGQAYIAMYGFDWMWNHTDGGRNGLRTKHVAIFKSTNGNLKLIGAFGDDRQAGAMLKKYGF